MKTLCGMLNGLGGSVIFGIHDSGRILGQHVTQRTIDDIHHEFKSFEPIAFPSVKNIPLTSGLAAIVVRVPGGGGPYTYAGRAYMRNGSSTTVMPKAAYERMLLERMHPYSRWEISDASGIEFSDLDQREIVRTIEEAWRRGRLEDIGTRDPLRILENLKLIRNGKLLNAGVVLFSNAEKLPVCYPQCILRMARFKGSNKNEFIDSQQVHGNIFELLIRAQQFLRSHLPVAGRIAPGRIEREEEPLYPTEALREALANAFCHRDYSIGGGAVNIAIYDDRLDISSTGLLPFGITPDQLYAEHTSLPWNPLIANVLYIRGIIENWGRGTIRMMELSQTAGLPRPTIECIHNEVRVRFYPALSTQSKQDVDDLNMLQKQILKILSEGPRPISTILEVLPDNIARRTVQENLNALKRLNLVHLTGKARNARWQLNLDSA